MFVKYTPKGDKAQRFEWDPDQVRAGEAEAIEKRFGDTWDNFRVSVMQGSVRARRILLWHLLKRQHPALSLDDVDFATGELIVEYSKTELAAVLAEVEKNVDAIPEGQRQMVLDRLHAELAAAPESEAGTGKARSNKSA